MSLKLTKELPMSLENTEISYRSASNADGENIRALVYKVLREYGLEPEPNGTDSDLNDLEANYIKRGGLFDILEDAEGNLRGTVGLFPIDEKTVELRKMYFDKGLRGRGYGKKTLTRMVEEAKRRGFLRIYLETASVLQEAVGLYKKFGFLPTCEKHTERCDQAFYLEL